jgi:hypothetical protein
MKAARGTEERKGYGFGSSRGESKRTQEGWRGNGEMPEKRWSTLTLRRGRVAGPRRVGQGDDDEATKTPRDIR